MYFAGADEILILGGTQAIAAMAFGTESIPKACHRSPPVHVTFNNYHSAISLLGQEMHL